MLPHTDVSYALVRFSNFFAEFLCNSVNVLRFSYYTADNRGIMFHFAEQVRFQVVANAPVLVDIFFTIR